MGQQLSNIRGLSGDEARRLAGVRTRQLGIAGTATGRDFVEGVTSVKTLQTVIRNAVNAVIARGGVENKEPGTIVDEILSAESLKNVPEVILDGVRKAFTDLLTGRGAIGASQLLNIAGSSKLTDKLNPFQKIFEKAAIEATKSIQNAFKLYEDSIRQSVTAQQQINQNLNQIVQVRANARQLIAGARGETLSLEERIGIGRATINAQARRGGAVGTAASISGRLTTLTSQRDIVGGQRRALAISGPIDPRSNVAQELIKLEKTERTLTSKILSLQGALTGLANDTRTLTEVQKEIANLQQRRGVARNFFGGLAAQGPIDRLRSNAERKLLLRGLQGGALGGSALSGAIGQLQGIQGILPQAGQKKIQKLIGGLIIRSLEVQGGNKFLDANIPALGGTTIRELLSGTREDEQSKFIKILQETTNNQVAALDALRTFQQNELVKSLNKAPNQPSN